MHGNFMTNAKKHKVVIITNLYPNGRAPTFGIFIKQLVARLSSRYEVQVIAPIPWIPGLLKRLFKMAEQPEIIEKIDGITVYHPRYLVIPKITRSLYGFYYFFCIYPLLKKLKKEFAPDLISSHWVYPDGFAAVLAAKKLGIKSTVHALGCDINEYTKFFLRKKLITFALNNANAVVVKSSRLKDRVLELGINEDKIHVILNGVNSDMFFQQDMVESRKHLDVSTQAYIYLFIGNFQIEKGLEFLIEAYSKVASSHKDVLLHIVGTGPLESKVNKKVTALGLENRIKFFGNISHEEIPRFLSASNVLCLPSLREGCPNVVLESLSCGTPVIASDVGAVRDIVTTDNRGLVVPRGDIDALSKALEKIYLSDHKRVTDFTWMSWDENAELVAGVFDRLITAD
jgi:teichuronic acid biosynthesis glycosyltransferase TuaC